MSGQQELFPTGSGYPVVDQDLQRMANAAASGDDLIYEAIMLPAQGSENPTIGNARKRVMPLMPEDPSLYTLASAGTPTAANLVQQQSAGVMTVRPAVFAAFGLSSGGTELAQLTGLVAKLRHEATISLTNGSGGNDRYDLLYATIQRSTAVTGARLLKNTTTGALTSSVVPLATDATVSLTLLPGTPSATPASPLASMPADTSTAWNFPLALILVPAAYVAGTDVVAAGGSVTPIWQRAGVAPEAIGSISELQSVDNPGAVIHSANYWEGDSTPGAGTYTSLPRQTGSLYRAMTQIELVAAGTMVLDNQRDWSQRLARISIFAQPPSGAAYAKLNAVVTTGPDGGVNAAGSLGGATWDSGWVFTGPVGGGGWVTQAPAAGLFNALTTGAISVSVDGSKRLAVTFGAGIAGGVTGHPRFMFLIEYTDRMVIP